MSATRPFFRPLALAVPFQVNRTMQNMLFCDQELCLLLGHSERFVSPVS